MFIRFLSLPIFLITFSVSAQVSLNNTSTEGGIDATAIGRESISSAEGTTAIGVQCEATGNNATSIGLRCKAGVSSTAIGFESEALSVATALGMRTHASGNYSTAMGVFANARGQYSTALGFNASANGDLSNALGAHITSRSYNSLAIGRYNLDKGDSLEWVDTDPILTVGNGTSEAPSNAMAILKNGLVLIGTITNALNENAVANTKLAVNGNIYAAGMRVRAPTNGSFPDYVFEDNYKLKPLPEVEDYIKANKHLEGIPSAKEIDKAGMDMVQMDIKLLEKVEELTLYMIAMKKNYDELKRENEQIKQELAIFKDMIEK